MLEVPYALTRIRDLPEPLRKVLRDLAEGHAHSTQSELAEIALATGIRQYLQDAFISSDLIHYWRYTLACGITCAELSKCLGLNTQLAFSCGLLHDLGRLALMTGYPAQYANLFAATEQAFSRNESVNISVQERLLFGFDRFQTGEWLVDKWELPAFFKGIAGKFQSVRSGPDFDLTALTRAGCSIAYAFGYGLMLGAPKRPIAELTEELPPEVIAAFGEELAGLKTVIDDKLERWSRLML